MRSKLIKKLLTKLATKIKSKNKKRGIKDEWQILNSGKFEKVGNDTRYIHTDGSNTVLLRCRINAHNDVCNTHRFARGNATDTASSNGRGISSVSRSTLSQRITTYHEHIHVLLRKTKNL